MSDLLQKCMKAHLSKPKNAFEGLQHGTWGTLTVIIIVVHNLAVGVVVGYICSIITSLVVYC